MLCFTNEATDFLVHLILKFQQYKNANLANFAKSRKTRIFLLHVLCDWINCIRFQTIILKEHLKKGHNPFFHTQQFSQIQMGNGGVHDGRCRSCGRKEELYHHCSQGENADKQTTKRTEDLHENVHVHWCHKKHGQTDEKAQVILFLSDFMVNSDACNNSSEPLLNTTTGSRGSNLW